MTTKETIKEELENRIKNKGEFMDKHKVIEQIDAAIHLTFDLYKPKLLEKAEETIQEFLNQYRLGFISSDNWCCRPMKEIAIEFWNMSTPAKSKDNFSNRYLFRGYDWIYCPFCGTQLTKRKISKPLPYPV